MLLNKFQSMFVCLFVGVFVLNGLENGWMDFDDSFFYLLTKDPGEVIVNFDFW